MIWGQNGQGKTNIVEAIYAAMRAKSFRPYSSRHDWIPGQSTNQGTMIGLTIESALGADYESKIFRKPDGNWGLELNGKRTTPYQFKNTFSIVSFSPDDHSLVRGAPDLRREFMDEVFGDVVPGYLEVLERFEKCLKQRNTLLKSAKSSGIAPNKNEFSTWSELLAKSAFELRELRREIFEDFSKRLSAKVHSLFADALPNFTVRYLADVDASSPQDFLKAFDQGYEVDLKTGWTHRGPHRDDFEMLLSGGLDAKSKSSQGQSRLIALALKWMHADWVEEQRGEIPVFLIDDLSSELDATRRSALISLIHSVSGQIFLTVTDPSLVDFPGKFEYKNVQIFSGQIVPK